MARDQRTRLNSELAYRYGNTPRKPAAPGRGAMTDGIEDKQPDEIEGEVVEEEQAVAAEAEQQVAPEPKKSIFELPRKEPARPSLAPGTPDAGAATGPAAPSSTKPTRR